MAGKTPFCSIVIRAFNEERHIGKLLEGILQQKIEGGTGQIEIILVDSGSTDATTTIAGQYPVKILAIEPEEFTFGRSLNQGITNARGEFIVIASAHVYPVYPDWLEKLLAPFSDDKVALSYGKQRGDSTTKFSEQQVLAQWFPDQSQARQTHPFCNNANAAIRRSLWQQHAYEETLTGLEDLEWSRWAIEQGYFLAYAADAEVVHLHNEKPHTVYNRYLREAMAFKRIFPEERFGLGTFLRLAISNIANDLWHAVQQRVFRTNWRSIFWFRWMQFWGTYQGYRRPGPVTAQLRKTFYYPHAKSALTPPNNQIRSREIKPINYRE